MHSRDLLLDRFARTGRNHPYLSVTVNSICDLDCVFCKPRCMEDYGPKDRALSVKDFTEIARAAGNWGVRKVHVSGGEPTLRPDIRPILSALREGLGPGCTVGVTSHGNLRRGLSVEDLAEAGLTNLNVSLHSLDVGRSSTIMGGGTPSRSLETIQRALRIGLNVKVNCVVQRTYIADALDVVELARDLPIAVRLIELQKIGPARALFMREFVSEGEMREQMEEVLSGATDFPRSRLGVRSSGKYLSPKGWAGTIGFISNTSCASCSDANRIKITPTGVARPCVLHNRDIELKAYINEQRLDEVFEHLFASMLGRNENPAWGGVHHIDYDLRWDRVVRPSAKRVLPMIIEGGVEMSDRGQQKE